MYGVPSLTRETGKGSHMQLEISWGTKNPQGGLQSADPCSTIIRIRYSPTMLMRRMGSTYQTVTRNLGEIYRVDSRCKLHLIGLTARLSYASLASSVQSVHVHARIDS